MKEYMKSVLFPLPLVLAFGLAGCGGGGSGSSSSAPAPLTVAPSGTLGGQNIGLTVTPTGTMVKLPCGASGAITQPLNLDANGNFNVPGTLTSGGASPSTITATYVGKVTNNTIHVTITPTGTGVIGNATTFDLTYNATSTYTSTCGR
jgi:hypothetical protein